MIVLDTTVLVYAKSERHPMREPCRELVAAVTQGRVEAATTAEVIQEFVHVRARRRGRNDAVALGRDYAELLSPLLTVTHEHLTRGLSLYLENDRLGAFDAVLAAAAAATGASALISADAAFRGVENLRHVVPDSSGVAEILA